MDQFLDYLEVLFDAIGFMSDGAIYVNNFVYAERFRVLQHPSKGIDWRNVNCVFSNASEHPTVCKQSTRCLPFTVWNTNKQFLDVMKEFRIFYLFWRINLLKLPLFIRCFLFSFKTLNKYRWPYTLSIQQCFKWKWYPCCRLFVSWIENNPTL